MSSHHSSSPSLLKQPKAVWAVAFACVIAFMGIGLVDPILPAISADLGATPAQTMLLFTSYLLVTGLAMFFTSFVSSRIGAKRTLLIGLALIVVFAALAGASDSVGMIIGFRAGWGLGNALFISTALATIVGAASGGADSAIILYEAALGLGIAIGPLLGGALGSISLARPVLRHRRADGDRPGRADVILLGKDDHQAGAGGPDPPPSGPCSARRCSPSAWPPCSTTSASSACSPGARSRWRRPRTPPASPSSARTSSA